MRNGDIVIHDQDIAKADHFRQVQNIIRCVIMTRRGSLKHSPTYGSNLMHEKAMSELQARAIEDIAQYIKEDIMYSIWLVHPILQHNMRCDYEIDKDNNAIHLKFYVKDNDVFVPIKLEVGSIATKLGIKLVID